MNTRDPATSLAGPAYDVPCGVGGIAFVKQSNTIVGACPNALVLVNVSSGAVRTQTAFLPGRPEAIVYLYGDVVAIALSGPRGGVVLVDLSGTVVGVVAKDSCRPYGLAGTAGLALLNYDTLLVADCAEMSIAFYS